MVWRGSAQAVADDANANDNDAGGPPDSRLAHHAPPMRWRRDTMMRRLCRGHTEVTGAGNDYDESDADEDVDCLLVRHRVAAKTMSNSREGAPTHGGVEGSEGGADDAHSSHSASASTLSRRIDKVAPVAVNEAVLSAVQRRVVERLLFERSHSTLLSTGGAAPADAREGGYLAGEDTVTSLPKHGLASITGASRVEVDSAGCEALAVGGYITPDMASPVAISRRRLRVALASGLGLEAADCKSNSTARNQAHNPLPPCGTASSNASLLTRLFYRLARDVRLFLPSVPPMALRAHFKLHHLLSAEGDGAEGDAKFYASTSSTGGGRSAYTIVQGGGGGGEGSPPPSAADGPADSLLAAGDDADADAESCWRCRNDAMSVPSISPPQKPRASFSERHFHNHQHRHQSPIVSELNTNEHRNVSFEYEIKWVNHDCNCGAEFELTNGFRLRDHASRDASGFSPHSEKNANMSAVAYLRWYRRSWELNGLDLDAPSRDSHVNTNNGRWGGGSSSSVAYISAFVLSASRAKMKGNSTSTALFRHIRLRETDSNNTSPLPSSYTPYPAAVNHFVKSVHRSIFDPIHSIASYAVQAGVFAGKRDRGQSLAHRQHATNSTTASSASFDDFITSTIRSMLLRGELCELVHEVLFGGSDSDTNILSHAQEEEGSAPPIEKLLLFWESIGCVAEDGVGNRADATRALPAVPPAPTSVPLPPPFEIPSFSSHFPGSLHLSCVREDDVFVERIAASSSTVSSFYVSVGQGDSFGYRQRRRKRDDRREEDGHNTHTVSNGIQQSRVDRCPRPSLSSMVAHPSFQHIAQEGRRIALFGDINGEGFRMPRLFIDDGDHHEESSVDEDVSKSERSKGMEHDTLMKKKSSSSVSLEWARMLTSSQYQWMYSALEGRLRAAAVASTTKTTMAATATASTKVSRSATTPPTPTFEVEEEFLSKPLATHSSSPPPPLPPSLHDPFRVYRSMAGAARGDGGDGADAHNDSGARNPHRQRRDGYAFLHAYRYEWRHKRVPSVFLTRTRRQSFIQGGEGGGNITDASSSPPSPAFAFVDNNNHKLPRGVRVATLADLLDTFIASYEEACHSDGGGGIDGESVVNHHEPVVLPPSSQPTLHDFFNSTKTAAATVKKTAYLLALGLDKELLDTCAGDVGLEKGGAEDSHRPLSSFSSLNVCSVSAVFRGTKPSGERIIEAIVFHRSHTHGINSGGEAVDPSPSSTTDVSRRRGGEEGRRGFRNPRRIHSFPLLLSPPEKPQLLSSPSSPFDMNPFDDAVPYLRLTWVANGEVMESLSPLA